MEADRWARTKKILDVALKQNPQVRQAFLEEVCGGDADLQREVEALLESEAKMGTFLQTSVVEQVDSGAEWEHESFRNLVLDMAQERSLGSLLQLIVTRLADRTHVALARIWLVQPGDICLSCVMRTECPDQTSCLHLVASAGKPLEDSGEDWSRLNGDFRRVPLGVRKVGYIGGEGQPACITNIKGDERWIARPEWAESERILGFGGQPLVFRGETLGVLALFTRSPFTEEAMLWLRMVADNAAVAITNARAFEEIERLKKQLEWENTQLRDELGKGREMGSYELVRFIGRGGMGEVWEGKHRMLALSAAVKLIPPGSLTLQGGEAPSVLLERFVREAQTTAALRSPYTVNVYHFGIGSDRTFYYVMELLDGVDFKTLVDKYGPLPPERVVYLLKQACHSLHEAHLANFTHRDVKPGNLFLCRYGSDLDFVKVLDFGLVKTPKASTLPDTELTQEGSLSGTPAFMAPEMIVMQGQVDRRADLYALGCVAYWLLTGQLVFEATSPMEMMVRHARDEPSPPSKKSELDIPARLDQLVLACMEKDPSKRPATAQEFSRMLDSLEMEAVWTSERAAQWWDLHRPSQ